MPTDDKQALIQLLSLPPASLLSLFRQYGIHDCDCPVKLRPCLCPEFREALKTAKNDIRILVQVRDLNQRMKNPAIAAVLDLDATDRKKVRRLQQIATRKVCDCPVADRVLPCPHAQAGDNPLPLLAHIFLLWNLFPAEYTEPPPAARPSIVLLARAKVADLAARRENHESLWHPQDALRRLSWAADDPDEQLQAVREVSNLRNGAPVFGELRCRPN